MTERMCLSVVGVQPHIHKQYRQAYYEKKGTLNGVYSKELPQDVALLEGVLDGRIILEGDSDLGSYGGVSILHTHDTERGEIPVYRKDERHDLTRLNIRNIPQKLCHGIRKHLLDKFSTYYGYMGRIVSMAMELGLKFRNGTVRVSKNSINYAEEVVRTCGGSPLARDFQDQKLTLKKVESMLERLLSSGERKQKKQKSKVASGKLRKAIKVLNEVKKVKKSSFTSSDYKAVLISLFGQGDERTIKSDLQLLKTAGHIHNGGRSGLFRGLSYKFTENKVYNSLRGSEARVALIRKLKKDFKDRKQVTKAEVEGLIRTYSGLDDSKFAFEVLDALLLTDCLIPYDPSGNIFDVNQR